MSDYLNTNNWGNQKQSFSNTGSCEDHLYLVENCRSKLQTNCTTSKVQCTGHFGCKLNLTDCVTKEILGRVNLL
jgi:hypothetical protein